MTNELENKELIEKLPKDGVHCYPANASKITRNRIVSVICFVIGVFLVLVGLLKVSDNIIKIGLLVKCAYQHIGICSVFPHRKVPCCC